MNAWIGALISLGSIIQQGSQFLFGIVVARALGPTDYGWFAIGRNVLIWAATLAPLGLDLAMLRYAAQHGSATGFWGVLSRLRTIVALVSLAIAIAVVGFSGVALEGGLAVVVVATVVALPFVADSSVLGGYYRGMRRPLLLSMLLDYGQSALRLLIGAVLLWFGATVALFALANSAVAAVGALVLALVAYAISPKSEALGRSPSIRAILAVSPWLALSLLSYGLLRLLDFIVLGAYVTGEELGRYAAIAAVSVFVQVYPMTLSQALGPQIAALPTSTGTAAAAVRDFVRRASVGGAYVYGGIAVFGTHLDLIFGEKFHFDPWVLLMMSTAWLLSGVLNPTGFALSMTGRHRPESLVVAGGAIVFALALLALVPPFGMHGAAGALLVAMSFIQGTRVIMVSSVIKSAVGTAWDLLPPVFALGVAKAIDFLTSKYVGESFASLVAACVVYTAVFGLAALAFGRSRGRRILPTTGG